MLQIDMREGNSKKYNVDATLGLISSKLTIEGPIIKEKLLFYYQEEERMQTCWSSLLCLQIQS